jgi:ATP/maltotriose-dependent transcriptional regulator MalT
MPRGLSARLRKAAELGVVEQDETRIRFVHPLLASAVLHGAPPELRRRVHRRLAAVVSVEEERIRHLALAAEGCDAKIATALDGAAKGALTRGAPAAAAELAEQARSLTPPESVADSQRRSIEAADYHLHAGDTARGRFLLEEVVATAPFGDLRAAGLQSLATVRLREESHAAAVELLEQSLREVRDPSRRAAIDLNLTVCLFQTGRLTGAAAHARAALALAEELDDPAIAGAALTYVAMLDFMLGRGMHIELVDRALTETERAEPGRRRGLSHVLPPEFAWGVMLKWADEFDAGRAKLEALRQHADKEQEEGWLPAILFHLGELACWLGDFELAGRYAQDAHEAAQESGSPTFEAVPLSLRALIAAHLGRVDEARSTARDGLAVAEHSGNLLHRVRCLAVLGFLDLSLGDPAAADRHLAAAAQLAASAGCADPGVLRFLPDGVEALVALGRLDEARALLDEFESRAGSLGRVSALAAAGRCRGLLYAAGGDLTGALASLEAALVEHEHLSIPFERARTLLVIGSVLRRAKRKTAPRASIGEALSVFERLGTSLWAQKARAELARVGGRPGPSVGLTPSERRLAALVAEGHSNKKIAAALFVSPKTVETNLSRLYGKVGVHSRSELTHRLGQGHPNL